MDPRTSAQHRQPRESGASRALAILVLAAGCGPAAGPLKEAPQTTSERRALDREFRELTESYNKRTGARQISVSGLKSLLQEGKPVTLLDVRQPEEHAVSSIEGSRLLPPEKVSAAMVARPAGATIVTYCTAGYRSGLAAVELEKRLGCRVYNLDGGIIAWFNAGGEVRDPSGEPVDRIHPYGEEWAKYVHPRPGSSRENSGNP